MQKVSGMLLSFEARLASGGDIEAAIAAVLDPNEYAPAIMKRRKVLGIIKETNLDAEYLLQTMRIGLDALSKVINGILYGEIGGKYDTLSNLSDIGGRANVEFRKNLDETLRRTSHAYTLLQKLVVLEKTWQENREARESKETKP